jgi:hypothetical protein
VETRHSPNAELAQKMRTAATNLLLKRICSMDLTIGLPTLMALGVLTLGLMFAFVFACEKV